MTCECCVDQVCFCQGVDLFTGETRTWCLCCQERACKCKGKRVHE